MKKYFILLFMVCSASIRIIGQNSICEITVVNQNIGANLMVEFDNGETISLKTRYRKNHIRSIDSYGNSEFVLILIEPITNYNEYIINGAFKLKDEWIQDYQDRSYLKINTGLTCTQISSIVIIDEQTLSVEYETTTSFDEYYKIETNLILGKHSLFEENTKVHHSYTMYGNGTKLKEAVQHSPRLSHSGM